MQQANPPFIRAVGHLLRRVAKTVMNTGVGLQGEEAVIDRLVPSTRVVKFKGKDVQHGYQNFVASTASLIGDVRIGEMSSAWYGATVRGDRNSVVIGRNSAVLDNAVVGSAPSSPTVIGDDVVISACASVTGATIGDGSMIGMGAVVMPGARVGNDCFIDAGAVVPAGTVVPSGTLWTGSPARQLRSLRGEEMGFLRSMANVYGSAGLRHGEQAAKSPEALEGEFEDLAMRKELRLPDAAPLPVPDPDVRAYLKLTRPDPTVSGLLRDHEFDEVRERALQEAEEVAADAAEEERYNAAAQLRRVGATLKTIAATRGDRAGNRARAIAELEARDPAGAAMARDIISRVSATAAAAGEPGAAGSADRATLVATLARLDPEGPYYGDDKEAAAAADAMFTALAAAGKDIPAAGRVGAGAAAAAAAGGAGAASAAKLA